MEQNGVSLGITSNTHVALHTISKQYPQTMNSDLNLIDPFQMHLANKRRAWVGEKKWPETHGHTERSP